MAEIPWYYLRIPKIERGKLQFEGEVMEHDADTVYRCIGDKKHQT